MGKNWGEGELDVAAVAGQESPELVGLPLEMVGVAALQWQWS